MKKAPLSVTAAIWGFVIFFAVLTLLGSSVSFRNPLFVLNENQVLYLFSTSAQVIAAIYGLTLTGFIFFRNELSREELEDDTLAEAVEELKSRYFNLLIFITLLVATTLVLSNLAIVCESNGSQVLTVLVLNGGQAAFFTSLAAISYFVFDVISPQRIEKMSRAIQTRIDPPDSVSEKGSLEAFLGFYNGIETLLQIASKPYLSSTEGASNQRYQRRLPNSRIAEMLFHRQVIDEPLYGELLRLVTLRNSIIHGAEPVVSASLVNAAQSVSERLKAALDSRK